MQYICLKLTKNQEISLINKNNYFIHNILRWTVQYAFLFSRVYLTFDVYISLLHAKFVSLKCHLLGLIFQVFLKILPLRWH